MTDLYSVKDVSRIFAVQESRLRYWTQVGFVGPTVRKGGRFYYTFRDLVAVKAAKDLLSAGLTLQKVRKNLDALRQVLPADANPAANLRICSDGETIVALKDDIAFEPATRQIVMAFNLPSLADRIGEVTPLTPRGNQAATAREKPSSPVELSSVPTTIDDDKTEAHSGTTAYRCFLEACAAEDAGNSLTAEHLFRQALEIEPALASAHTNLGNLLYRQGDRAAARASYERALELEPTQPEARYNLGNILEDFGDTELAIAELRRVCALCPDFADAHYNLGLLLVRVGGVAQAQTHLRRYLELDSSSEWAERARTFVADLAA
jgi:tetratricopeptide (TPR) repeat protein